MKADNPKGETEPVLTEEKLIEKEEAKKRTVESEQKRRVPEVVNSRAAMFGDIPDIKRDVRSFL